MSSASGLSAAGLGVVAQTSEPAWVRSGSAATKQSYEQALAFEEVLVEELSSSLAGGALGGAEEAEGASSEEGSATSQPGIAALAPQALTSAVMGAGGLGLAAQLTRSSELGAGTAAELGAAAAPAGSSS
jgi:hypothetical protein